MKQRGIWMGILLLLVACQNNSEDPAPTPLESLNKMDPEIQKEIDSPPGIKSADTKTLESVEELNPQAKREPQKENVASKTIAGTYRCWSYNVGGIGKSCTSPPFVFLSDSTYSMSKEKGSYTIDADQIILSESTIRGPGTLLEDNRQIRFTYDYNGLQHTVTYAKFIEENIEGGGQKYVEVFLTISFPYDASGINTVTLIAKGAAQQAGETLAYEVAENTVEAVFRKVAQKNGIATEKVYDIYVSSGFSPWKIGELDLRGKTGDVTLSITAPPVNNGEELQKTAQSKTTICDPTTPNYMQSGCITE